MALQKPPTFEEICKELIALQEGKGKGYINSPFNILPKEYWLSQIAVKAVRAGQSTSEEKMIDELRDTAVYSILMMMKLRGADI
jgi:hypothetical protein